MLGIYGHAQSDVIFKLKLVSVRKGFKKEIEVIFLRAPFDVSMKNIFNIDVEEEAYEWWFISFNAEDHLKQLFRVI